MILMLYATPFFKIGNCIDSKKFSQHLRVAFPQHDKRDSRMFFLGRFLTLFGFLPFSALLYTKSNILTWDKNRYEICPKLNLNIQITNANRKVNLQSKTNTLLTQLVNTYFTEYWIVNPKKVVGLGRNFRDPQSLSLFPGLC